MNGYNLINHLLYQPIQDGFGGKVALIEQNMHVTYNQLNHIVSSIVVCKEMMAVAPGSIVACVMNDSILSAATFLALIHKGAVPCMLNPNISLEHYHEYFSTCQPTLLVLDHALVERYSLVADRNKMNTFIPNESLLKTMDADSTRSTTPVDRDQSHPAFCLFTSGTTGQPLTVLHRHIDVAVMNNDYVQTVLNINANDTIFATSRFHFAYGLNALLIALMNKATLVIAPAMLDPTVVWQMIEQEKPTVFFSVPTMYLRLLHANNNRNRQHTSIRMYVSAGENLPAQLNSGWQNVTGKYIIDGIGTTEILSTFISNRLDHFRLGSTGVPVRGFSIEIRDTNNKRVPPGEIGILWVKGNTYLDCYFNHLSATKEKFLDGWFKTNDLFSQDQDGFYFYHGRASEAFKVSGIWVYPYRIEQALNTHAAVFESALIGKEHENGLMRPEAFIVLNPGFSVSDELIVALKELCKEKCSKQEYPHFINFINTIPKTASGKLRRFILKMDREEEYA